MTVASQRDYERALWSDLHAQLAFGMGWDEVCAAVNVEHPDDLSDADGARLQRAVNRVVEQLRKKAGPV